MPDLLGPNHQAMLDFIEVFIDRHGYAPTVREMQDALGISSTSVVSYRMRILQREGRLEWEEGRSRTVRLVGHNTDSIVIRLAGDDAKMFRNAVGHGDPKALVMEAVRRDLRTRARRPTTNSAG